MTFLLCDKFLSFSLGDNSQKGWNEFRPYSELITIGDNNNEVFNEVSLKRLFGRLNMHRRTQTFGGSLQENHFNAISLDEYCFR